MMMTALAALAATCAESLFQSELSGKFAPYQFALRREVPDRDRIECDQTDRFCFNAVSVSSNSANA
jgi:hypothetical protein